MASASGAWVRVFGVVLVLGGLGLLGLSWHLGRQQQQFLAGSAHTQGTITSLNRHDYLGNGGHPTHSIVPVVQFRDQQGQMHSFQASAVAARPSLYTVGEQVRVDYNPAHPTLGAQVHAPVVQHIPAVVTGILGLVVSGLGLLCLLVLGRGPGGGGNMHQSFSRTWKMG